MKTEKELFYEYFGIDPEKVMLSNWEQYRTYVFYVNSLYKEETVSLFKGKEIDIDNIDVCINFSSGDCLKVAIYVKGNHYKTTRRITKTNTYSYLKS